MVEVNFGHRRPRSVIALHGVAELRGWEQIDGRLVLGPGLTYTEMLQEPLAGLLPALAQAARTVGSPQIRNAGTLGGNLGTGSPAGDTLPVLIALDAVVELASASGTRRVPVHEFCQGPKLTDRRPDEVIVAVHAPVLQGPQEFLKVGTRNAMVISVASVALVTDRIGSTVRCGLGSVGPVPLRCPDAEAWVSDRLPWGGGELHGGLADEFGRRAAAAAAPITDHRSTAEYRRHAVSVCAARALRRAFA
jgi:CO/xanthine dehydrogenase FAD-binding subunit